MDQADLKRMRELLTRAAGYLEEANKERWARFCRKTPEVLEGGNSAILILVREFFEPKGDYERMTRYCDKEALHLGIDIHTLVGKLGETSGN